MREYRAEFDDGAILMVSAQCQADALAVVSDHAHAGQEFTLTSRHSQSAAEWDDIKVTSLWQIGYDGGGCRRMR